MYFTLPEMNYLSVFISAAAMMMIGAIWYGPLFGKVWMQGLGLNPNDQATRDRMKQSAVSSYLQMFIGALLTSFVFAYFFGTWWNGNVYDQAISGMFYGFLVWIGFVVPVIYGRKLWEGKGLKYVIVDLGYYLVALIAVGVITALMVNINSPIDDGRGNVETFSYASPSNSYTIGLSDKWKDYKVFESNESTGAIARNFCLKTTSTTFGQHESVPQGYACPFGIFEYSESSWDKLDQESKNFYSAGAILGIKDGVRFVYTTVYDIPTDLQVEKDGELLFDSFFLNN